MDIRVMPRVGGMRPRTIDRLSRTEEIILSLPYQQGAGRTLPLSEERKELVRDGLIESYRVPGEKYSFWRLTPKGAARAVRIRDSRRGL